MSWPAGISAAVLLAIGAGGGEAGAQSQGPADAQPGAQAAMLQCAAALVSIGDTRDQVLAKCGSPVKIERSTAFVRSMAWVNGVPVAAGNSLIEVPVELWLYSLGPGQSLRRVRFESGRVVAIEVLGND